MLNNTWRILFNFTCLNSKHYLTVIFRKEILTNGKYEHILKERPCK